MRKHSILALLLLVLLSFSCKQTESYKTLTKTDDNGYSYEIVEGDALEARVYELKNGLKVYMANNDDAPRIMTMIAVRAGSKNDPSDNTGMAHYFEHLMFKGTDEIGTLNWEKEKELIDQISALYEKRKQTEDEQERLNIFKKIDSLSQIAAQYAVPNEYDKTVNIMGAKMTNAFTSKDVTAYMNDIPSNELERWLQVENERFEDPVYRLFHTELETVYEEFNMSQDNDRRQAYYTAYAELFKNHPYGIPVLGKGEHLKNPSMVSIRQFQEKYYVPNNMAVCLMGDIDFDKTIQLIDKYWGNMEAGEEPKEIEFQAEEEISEPIVKEVYGPDAEFVSVSFRTPGNKSDKAKYFSIMRSILSNSQAGLFDLNLTKNQKVQRAYASFSEMNDYGVFTLTGYNRKDQSLEEVKDLLLGELDKLKSGAFDDWLREAVINEKKLNRIRSYDQNWAVYNFIDAFISQKKWEDVVVELDEMTKLSKDDIVNYAKDFFKDNYVVVYKREGENKDKMTVEKPPITPVDINRNENSEFFKEISSLEPENIEPEFINFDEKLKRAKLAEGLDFFYTKNPSNNLAYVYYMADMGKNHNKMIPVAMEYLKYIGTNKYSLDDLNKEFYKIGIDYFVSSSNDRSYVYISGLDENLGAGIELLEQMLADAKPDKDAYEKTVDKILKDRSNMKKNKGTVLWSGLYSYAKYGELSPFNDVLSEEELRAIDPKELTDLIKEIFTHKHKVYYYGPKEKDDAQNLIAELHKVPEKLKDIPEEKQYPEKDTEETKVYFCDYDMVQAQIILLSKDKTFDKSEMPIIRMFNEYYGGSMASVVFQEMREAAGLAYSAFAGYSTASEKDKSNYVFAYIATQPDKIEIAMNRFNELLNNMLESEKAFSQSKESIIKSINSERITKDDVFWTYLNNKELGIEEDIREDVYKQVQEFELEDLKGFFNKRIKDKNYNILVIGSKDKVDFKTLEKFGPTEELTLEELFNY